MSVCGVLARDHIGEPKDKVGCVLVSGHRGPHECVCADTGDAYLWETDMSCECSHCMQFDGDYCYTIWRKPQSGATTGDRSDGL